jgi:serine carboxypeptidase-like clade 4
LAPNPFYIFGESYAGHYIPSLTAQLISNYANNNIRLSGIGVGDGWTNPFI